MAGCAGMRFGGRYIDRALVANLRKDAAALAAIKESPAARFLLVRAGSLLATKEETPALLWSTRQEVLGISDEADAEAIYLGPAAEGGPSLAEGEVGPMQVYATDVTPFVEVEPVPKDGQWISARNFMLSSASDADVSVAGIALALTSWSSKARFDGASGQPTEPVEGGVKRKEVDGKGRLYPRTDPVVISLIMSPDKERVLLQRVKAYMPKMYTCISGFIDQGETVEDALRREAKEEVDMELSSIQLMQSQSWPVGRAGSCELMIGCHAVSASDHFKVNLDELDDARWFSKEDVVAMMSQTHPDGLFVPGKFAIAHHLIRSWACGSSM